MPWLIEQSNEAPAWNSEQQISIEKHADARAQIHGRTLWRASRNFHSPTGLGANDETQLCIQPGPKIEFGYADFDGLPQSPVLLEDVWRFPVRCILGQRHCFSIWLLSLEKSFNTAGLSDSQRVSAADSKTATQLNEIQISYALPALTDLITEAWLEILPEKP